MIIDSHAHLDYPQLADDLPAVLARAHEAGVDRVITIGVKLTTVDRPRALAEANDNIWFSAGVHPHEAGNEADACNVEAFLEAADHPRCVAIGEAGLDYHYDYAPRDRQAESMVQKLCDRFDMSDEPRVHQDIAFCIGALSHTERSVLKLLEMQKTFVNKLGDDEVRADEELDVFWASAVSNAREGAEPSADVNVEADDELSELGVRVDRDDVAERDVIRVAKQSQVPQAKARKYERTVSVASPFGALTAAPAILNPFAPKKRRRKKKGGGEEPPTAGKKKKPKRSDAPKTAADAFERLRQISSYGGGPD